MALPGLKGETESTRDWGRWWSPLFGVLLSAGVND